MSQSNRRDALDIRTLRAGLAGSFIGNQVIVLPKVASTNDYVWQLARKGSSDGLVVFAECQTAGRGQRGNSWESNAYLGLWFSILLRPRIDPVDSARLTSWAALGVATTIKEQLGIAAVIQSSNDVLVQGRKVTGVLVEMRVESGGTYAAIVGIGVNVNQTLEEFSLPVRDRAGSLAMVVGEPVDRSRFALALLRQLDRTHAFDRAHVERISSS